MKKSFNDMTGPIYTGFYELDRLIGEIRGGKTVLLAGRPGMGQSKLLHFIARSNEGKRMIFADIPALINEREKYLNTLKKLSEASREMNVPLIAAVTVGREVEEREDKCPTLADLGEAGEIADYAVCIYRDYYYNYEKYDYIETLGDLETELIVVKRDGKTVEEKIIIEENINEICNI